jgi:hypothetical protein
MIKKDNEADNEAENGLVDDHNTFDIVPIKKRSRCVKV